MTPRPQMKISFIRYEIKNDERFIIRVTIPESVVKPIILKYKNIPSIFMRRDGFTNGATYEEIIEMSIQSKNIQYDILTSDTIYDPAQFTTLRSFYKNHNDGHELKEKFLNSIGFYNEERFLSNGAVLSQIIIVVKKLPFSAPSSPALIKAVKGLSQSIAFMEISLLPFNI